MIKRKFNFGLVLFVALFIMLFLSLAVVNVEAADTTPPTYSVVGHSGSTGGAMGSFYLYASDETALNAFIFSYKVGSDGSYANLTAALFSSTPGWGNISITLPALDTDYFFKFFFNDTSNNWNVTIEQMFSVTYSVSPSPSVHVQVGETRNLYFRSDVYTTLGVSAYGLDDDYTHSLVESNVRSGVGEIRYGLRVYLVTSSTIETELTSGINAIVTLTNSTGNFSGLVHGYWTIPETDILLGYQALEVEVYSYASSGAWSLEKTFISPVLISKQIISSQLDLALYVDFTVSGSNVSSYFIFGDITEKSGLFNLQLETPRESDIQMWRLTTGDYVGFEVGAYVDIIGEAFYILLLVLFGGVLYFRYGHFGTVAFFFVLFGGAGGLVWFFVPVWAATVVSAFVILGTSFIVWRVIR